MTVEIVAVAWVSGIVAAPETCFEALYCCSSPWLPVAVGVVGLGVVMPASDVADAESLAGPPVGPC